MSQTTKRLWLCGAYLFIFQAFTSSHANGQGQYQGGQSYPPNSYYQQAKPGAAARSGGATATPRAGYGTPSRYTPSAKGPATPNPIGSGTAPAPRPADVPTPQQALKLAPVQKDVDYSRPSEEEIPRCKVSAFNQNGQTGWIVEDPQGLMLRKFVDTNGDNRIDQWSYYKDGLEVYREIDGDFNGRVDQYRWFHTGGSRWGIDKDEDGTIDGWKEISAEETSAEIVAALAQQDADRFARVLLTPAEAQSLGLGAAKAKELLEKLSGTAVKFRQVAGRADLKSANDKPDAKSAPRASITPQTKWIQFAGSQPGIVPAGTDGSVKDIAVYENALALVQTGSDHGQVQIGTLVKVGSAWKVIDAPQLVAEGQTDAAALGFFFRAPQTQRPQVAASGLSEKTQELLAQLEKLDAAAAGAASSEQQAAVNAKRADLLERLVTETTKPEDRAMWLRQLADMLSAAAQSGGLPDGLKRLDTLLDRVQRSEQDKVLVPYVKFRCLTAEYGLAMQAKGADFAKIQSEWLKKLQQYVADYPRSPDCVEAMLQLAMAEEFAGHDEEAKKWYGRIAAEFAEAPEAKKATGARARLDSVGKVLTLRGKTPAGEEIDVTKLRGRVVLVQYWATTSEQCKADMAALKELASKYGTSFAVVGIDLDNDVAALNAYLNENRLPWPQVFEQGGRDSRLATELGILTLPTMILLDQEGRVVNRNVTATELGAELKKLVR